MRPLVTFSENILNALNTRAQRWGFDDAVLHLDNGILGGTMTYTGWIDRAWGTLLALLSEAGIEASGLISYFSIEEVSD